MDPQQNQQMPQGGMGGNMGNMGNMGPNAGAGGANQKEDYVDKAFDMATKKAGHPMDRNTSEKITDGARNMFEKVTGKQVNPKISN